MIPYIPRIPTLISHIPTLIPIIPLIPFPDSPFRLLQIAIFALKYGNTKVSNVLKYEKVMLALEIFHCTCLH